MSAIRASVFTLLGVVGTGVIVIPEQGVEAALVVEAGAALSDADRAAVFKTAGAVHRKGKWVICAPPAEPGASVPEGAAIETVQDMNGDGRPEAVVVDSGSYCYGNMGAAFKLLSKQPNGSWRLITEHIGTPHFLPTRGAGGWPDIQIGGPGFCFPVQRWNGKAYVLDRHEYEGKRCQPPR